MPSTVSDLKVPLTYWFDANRNIDLNLSFTHLTHFQRFVLNLRCSEAVGGSGHTKITHTALDLKLLIVLCVAQWNQEI